MEQWNCKINVGINIENGEGSRVLIIVKNIIDNIALIKCIELRSERRVTEISFQKSLFLTDLDLLLRVVNNQVVISQIESTTLQSIAYQAKKNNIEQVMI